MGGGFTLVIVLLGALREFLGTGGIGADMQLLFGEAARSLHLQILGANYPGFY